MKKNFFRKWGLLCLSIFAFTNLTAQEFSSERDRLNAMVAEEAKIQAFIDEHVGDELPEAVNVFVNELLKHDHDDDFHSEATPEEEQRLKQQVRRKYFRHLYLRENPQAAAIFQPAALANCLNGDFEMGDFTSYGAASGLRSSSTADCDVASILFSPETPQTIETVSTGAGINCEIVTVGNDPLIPTLPRVRSGSFAARINQTNVLFGINQITKKVVLTQPNEEIGFWFSLVMQNPNGHNNRQPFFKARALDPMGGLLDEVCEFADSSNPFFGDTILPSQGLVVYSPYFCQTLELAGNVGDTITIEISTADCGAGGHWGYSYIDDICDVCTVDSCNYQGDVDLDPTDTCSDITQVCGTYNLAALNCTTATVHDLTLGIYQGGSLINTLTGGTIDLINQTFCFNISPADFLGNTGGFDFQANITFNINGSFNSESDLNTNPGVDNDYITDPDCCPEFEVLDCCTYWSLPAGSSARSADGAVADRKIQEVLTEYREQIQAKYGKSVSETDCNPCEFPNDQFPIFIVDENNMLIDDTQYNITWSHNPGWTAAYSWISPNQQTIVTVTDPNDSACSWTDTFYYECCDLDVEIVPLCTTCDPCSNPGQPFFLAVEDQNGNPLSTTGYSFLWNTGSMASGINGVVNTVYTVTVTELATGCMSTDTFSIVCCKCDIKADFDFDVQKCKVEFKDQSSLDTCNTIVSYAWDFGDGATGTGANPTHTYAANGTYLACLVVTATNGAETCSDTICKKVDIKDCDACPCELKPDFRFDIDRCDVKFESDAGAGSCTQVTSYFWDFGDGNTSTAMNPVHTYAANGSYTVCLTVEGTNGTDICKEKICYEVVIEECKDCECSVKPDFRFEVSGCDVRFDGDAGANECTKVLQYYWDFGDGNNSALEDPVHTYSANGTYTVCLTVEGTNGTDVCKNTICYEVTIEECKDCECSVKPDFRFEVSGCDVRFDGDAGVNECTKVLQYYWDFGDGNNSALEDPTHTYAANGSYTVCLTVEGTNGTDVCKNTICYEVKIEECKDCDCKVESNFVGLFGIKDPCTVFFNDLSTTNACTNITDWKWDFGDGTNSSLSNPSHSYSADGTYEVCLTVIANNGVKECESTFCRKINISGCKSIGIGIGISKSKQGTTTEAQLNDFDATVYPNPFNNVFSVNFSNSAAQQVTVSLIDSRGTEVGVLSNEVMNEGQHKLEFSAVDLQLADGIYFLSIRSETEVSYRKIVYRK